MKRTLILLTLFCLILLNTAGFAENTQDEILFRGILWGTSLTDFTQKMEASDFFGKVRSDYSLYSWERIAEPNRWMTCVSTLKDAGFTYSSGNEATVAGIPVSETTALFMFSFDNDQLFTEKDKSQLYYASYTLNPVDISSVLPILEEKLNRLYGENQKFDSQLDFSNHVDYTSAITWYGANHTGVRLYIRYKYDKITKEMIYTSLKLEYGKTNSVELLRALKDAQAREEVRKIQSNDSVDGL